MCGVGAEFKYDMDGIFGLLPDKEAPIAAYDPGSSSGAICGVSTGVEYDE